MFDISLRERVVERVLNWRGSGMTYSEMEELTGVSDSTLWRIARFGVAHRITFETAHRIMEKSSSPLPYQLRLL